ncbi:AAA family ATPase [Paraclostridium sordellii]|uniref:AAA family ATPase n=1 Tax=Paraclostridium sordellii TaxID=1505 RepID=UPI0005E6AC5A|nr:AAA family ATPase [Paeniclostridium sordellii]MBX9179413.1 AAA family ATPase [Paeniclostridium sordellii]MDU1454055.1 AAA family ATPase [Paeniclostridium sordellii]MRZ79153.1 AAA family ATPase [Paeniclostridium sordellii]MSB60126.1 AAA family ATPase [Paeniclostridium sordellii]CEN81697.1 AAA domain-containing protein [[Clostridium] sordellii] [Paeniclostridium sordellii]
MRKKLIIINGVMGVGKTSVSKALYKQLDNSFWLDGDNCWMMNPFEVTSENKYMVIDNITYLINNFIKNSKSKYIILNWVIHTDEIMDSILYKINMDKIDLYKITLICDEDTLVKRIKKDIKSGIRDEDNIKRSLDKLKLYKNMNTLKIDTANKSIDEIVENIKNIINN